MITIPYSTLCRRCGVVSALAGLLIGLSSLVHAAAPNGLVGYGAGTTGGGTAAAVTVTTAADFKAKCEDTTTRKILVGANLTFAQGTSIKVKSNKTIYSTGRYTISGACMVLTDATNIIVQNLKFAGLWNATDTSYNQYGDPAAYDSFPWDYFMITRCNKIWLDHLDLKWGYDGMLDIYDRSTNITISWCRFYGQKKGTFVGRTEDTDYNQSKVTYHHCLFEQISNRAPKVRGATVHVFNCYYKNILKEVDGPGDVVITGVGAAAEVLAGGRMLIDTCYFQNAVKPTLVSDSTGYLDVLHSYKDGTSGAWQEINPSGVPRPSYNYSAYLDPVADVPSIVSSRAGATL
jgi:pectate lyase